ncbi:HepT-like ribonuclease domain-containing protein [Pelomicrobium sp. G1]|uniref:HepT-like ribonuclease domain-containing protein n=1 Tax=unclassified Pelomicrobium TaxID=2815318 RepID=UPI003F75AFD7
MSPRKWPRRLEDILDAISEIRSFVAGMPYDQFRSDAKTLKAVEADLMIIGEAAGHIPDDVQQANPEVPWHLMRAMRNRIVHVYFDIDPRILWDTIQQDLPLLEKAIKKLLEKDN